MSKGINRAFLLGHVGKDPDIRSTNGGAIVASLSLATGERQKDGQGNWQDKTEWHNLVAFNRTAEIIRDYVRKGSQLMIEGKIRLARGMTGNPAKRSIVPRSSFTTSRCWAAIRKSMAGIPAVAVAMPGPQALGIPPRRMARPTPNGRSRTTTSLFERTIVIPMWV